jgi:hypothetical protein
LSGGKMTRPMKSNPSRGKMNSSTIKMIGP